MNKHTIIIHIKNHPLYITIFVLIFFTEFYTLQVAKHKLEMHIKYIADM